DPGVERRTNDPRVRCRMPADAVPRHPGSGERLGDQILGQLPIARTGQDRPQAYIPAGLVELLELQLLHTPYTLEGRDPLTGTFRSHVPQPRESPEFPGTQESRPDDWGHLGGYVPLSSPEPRTA